MKCHSKAEECLGQSFWFGRECGRVLLDWACRMTRRWIWMETEGLLEERLRVEFTVWTKVGMVTMWGQSRLRLGLLGPFPIHPLCFPS